MSAITTSIKHCSSGTSQSDKARKRNNNDKIMGWKGRSQIVIICRLFNNLHRNQEHPQTNIFSKVARNQPCWYTQETELKKILRYHLKNNQKYKVPL